MFAETHGDKQMNVMLNELIGKMKTLKLQDVRQNTIHVFFKKRSCKLLQLTKSRVRFLSMMMFSSKKPKSVYSGHSL